MSFTPLGARRHAPRTDVSWSVTKSAETNPYPPQGAGRVGVDADGPPGHRVFVTGVYTTPHPCPSPREGRGVFRAQLFLNVPPAAQSVTHAMYIGP